MAAIINTNIASLNAQRNLTTSQSALATSLQRLSTGLRINSAKDDAAGLAIADRFSTQIRGLNQAVRNANDGISLAQTAEGALGEIGNNLQRIRELAVQAANSTNSASDRAAINQEVQQRLQEIDRTASQTSFNGQKILDGSFGSANFQVGANAGETIGLSLNTSMRASQIGKIATTTTAGTVGAAGTGGTHSITASSFDFSQAGAAATAGRVTFAPTQLDFGTTTTAGTNGTNQFTAAAFDFRSGSSAAFTIANTDFSGGAANVAQFDVQIGSTTVGITLNADYTDVNGVAGAIQSQLNAVAGLENVTVDENGGDITINNVGGSAAVNVLNNDANAATAGLAAAAGTAGSAQPIGQFEIDGQLIELTGDYTDADGLAQEIQNQIQAYGGAFASYSVTANGNIITIDNDDNGGAAVAITGANGSANQAGISNSAGTAGVAGTTANDASFEIGGATITLDEDYGSIDVMATKIGEQLETQDPGAFSVSVNGGSITISRTDTGAGSTALDITNGLGAADAAAITSGGTRTGNAGTDEIVSTNASFKVDGQTVTLNGNYTDAAGLRGALAAQLSNYDIGGTGDEITITNKAFGSAAVTISDADPNAFSAGIVNGSGTAGVSGGSVTLADFSISVGGGDAISLNGTYESVDQLAESINKNVQGVYASVSGGKLTLSSSSDLELGGTDATGSLGFAAASVAANSGSLDDINTLSVEGSLSTLQRVDAALTSVNSLRSTFGAIQNRFESVISNLSSTSENLSAARSRIQDADFAAETAALTRGQILQQAGTAMLAQANSLPNGVLALLRG